MFLPIKNTLIYSTYVLEGKDFFSWYYLFLGFSNVTHIQEFICHKAKEWNDQYTHTVIKKIKMSSCQLRSLPLSNFCSSTGQREKAKHCLKTSAKKLFQMFLWINKYHVIFEVVKEGTLWVVTLYCFLCLFLIFYLPPGKLVSLLSWIKLGLELIIPYPTLYPPYSFSQWCGRIQGGQCSQWAYWLPLEHGSSPFSRTWRSQLCITSICTLSLSLVYCYHSPELATRVTVVTVAHNSISEGKQNEGKEKIK